MPRKLRKFQNILKKKKTYDLFDKNQSLHILWFVLLEAGFKLGGKPATLK